MEKLLELRQQMLDGVHAGDPNSIMWMFGLMIVGGIALGVLWHILGRFGW